MVTNNPTHILDTLSPQALLLLELTPSHETERKRQVEFFLCDVGIEKVSRPCEAKIIFSFLRTFVPLCLRSKKKWQINFSALFLLLTFLSLPSFSLTIERVSIRIFADLELNSALFSGSFGKYEVWGDGKLINENIPEDIFQFVVNGDSVNVKTLEKSLGKYSRISLKGITPENNFKLKPLIPEKNARVYEDDLEIYSANKLLVLLNKANIENYTCGVVYAESGGTAAGEYYKLQAVLVRTYTLSHLRRHELEGFNLCDQVHCQAYKGKVNNEVLEKAVESSKGLVVVDADLKLITAAYHSNCGGQTINCEDVWSLPTSYLKAVKDTFCLKQPNAKWQKKIPAKEWEEYLVSESKYLYADTANAFELYNYQQNNNDRERYYLYKSVKIPLKKIREDWHLKSTFFSIEEKEGMVIFSGKGFGHGVGMCQEGAMRMALLGYSYKDMIHFYYKDVHIVDLSVLDFFRQE